MGVDLAVYRARVGQFVPRIPNCLLTNFEYLCKAIASIRCGMTHDKMDRKGAVTFIALLLRAQGIEPNPGPGNRDQQPTENVMTEDDMNINSTSDSIMSSVLNQAIVSVLQNPTDTKRSSNNEYAGAVARPGPFTGVVSQSNLSLQVVINQPKLQVKNLKVKHADFVNTGEQTIIHTEIDDDEEIPKPKKARQDEMATENANRKRPATEENTIKDSDNLKRRKKDEEVNQKSDKRNTLEENAETMLKRHIEETANILVTRTAAEKAVVKRIKDYHMVVISGVTGEGKTTLGREICKKLRDGNLDESIKRKTPILITVPQDWSDVVNDKDDIVVFVDDIFGKTNYQTGLLNGWSPFFDRILQCLHKGNVCLVVTSRTHILKDARRESGVLSEMISDHILSEKKTVDLTVDHKLTYNERLDIYNKHSNQRQAGGRVMSTMPLTYHEIRLFPSNISIGFAQICNLFFTNDTFFEKGEKFFGNPLQMLTEEIERMRLTEPHKYFALVYCFLNDQTLDSRKLNRLKMEKDDYENLKVLAEVCGVIHTGNVLAMLKDGLNALDRTYLTRQNTVFTFGHQSIADSVSLVFGKENPELILEKCSNRVILEQLDVAGDDETELCTLHVPVDCFGHLSKRIYRMIMEGKGSITLESFPRFRNQEFADCLFEYITTKGDIRSFLLAHSVSFLEKCSSNSFFLRAFFNFNLDEFIVEEYGILEFAKSLQGTLKTSLKHRRLESISILLEKGAILTAEYLELAFKSEELKLVELVLSMNIWTKSEIKEHNSYKNSKHLRETLKNSAKMCEVRLIRSQYLTQKSYANPSSNAKSLCIKDMEMAAQEMDFNTLQKMCESPQLKKHCSQLIKAMLDSKHKRLLDVIAIKRIFGQIDGEVVRHALHSCDLDMFRFLLFSSTTNAAQLNSMLSEAIHLNKSEHIEVLVKAGGKPSHDEFVRKAGTNCTGVETVVETIMQATNWTPTQLAETLDAAVSFGAYTTIKVLLEGGAEFSHDALVNVCKRRYDPLVAKIEMIDRKTPEERKIFLEPLLQFLKGNTTDFESLTYCIPISVEYVFSNHEWSEEDMSKAIHAALESGSLHTVLFLRHKGGTLQNDALSTAVGRKCNTLNVVKFVRMCRKWSVDQLSNALHQALVLCRPDVVDYLHTEGAEFNTSSLQNVLQWHVEHHVQIRVIKYILENHKWSPEMHLCAIRFASDTNSPAIHQILEVIKTNLLTSDILLKLQEVKGLKEKSFRLLKSKGMTDELTIVLNKEIQEGGIDIVEHLTHEMNIPCDNDSLSNAMDNTRNYQSYNRLKMVSLVQESRDWSDDLLMKALDKAVKLGYTDVIFYLHDHGAMFSDQSLEYAIVDKNMAYDTYGLVIYMMKSRQYNKQQMDNALQKSLEVGHFQLVSMFYERGAEFTDKSLQNAIHKMWKTTERLPAVQFVLRAREWDAIEKNDALLSAVRLGDVRVIGCLLRCGGEVSNRCLSEVLHKKCKPSHRLSIIRLLLSGSTSLLQKHLEDAMKIARSLSESKLEEYIQKQIMKHT
ncbi:uncharacterized protein LOC132557854 [Ylistrum balloti]|uniref:uncharacterized protein LOC132557854 n=1 Tax=Ylistrum balloti TaxID=509963 RepID=UPI002905C8AD|nr:uncharacterized protein LOC132557854 [Ylistrum balloti]